MSLSLLSWNVNGIRAAHRKGFVDWLLQTNADFVCVQETKLSHIDQIGPDLTKPEGYFSYWDWATEKKGYSGVAIYSKQEPKKVITDFGDNILSWEGRMIQLDFENYSLINIYFPNGGASKERLEYKLLFYKKFLAYIKRLEKKQPNIIFCGDVNTAHNEIDLARPKQNEKTSGFMPIEREWLDKFETAGFTDTYRLLHPNKKEMYSWWDMKTRSRDRNVGWRIDYFYISKALHNAVQKADILTDVFGSDHCPVALQLNIKK